MPIHGPYHQPTLLMSNRLPPVSVKRFLLPVTLQSNSPTLLALTIFLMAIRFYTNVIMQLSNSFRWPLNTLRTSTLVYLGASLRRLCQLIAFLLFLIGTLPYRFYTMFPCVSSSY